MRILLFASILPLFLLSSCGLIAFLKIQDAFEIETISNQSFKEELDFQEMNGFIVIQVAFEGQLKNFILDTGATTSLDQDFAAKLKVKHLGKVKTFDSNNSKKYIPYVTVEEFAIGNISFYNMVASISNMEILDTAACIKVSGIIGVNAIKKCIWQIDYQRKKIVITSDRDYLDLSGKEKKIDFSVTGRGTPVIPLYTNKAYLGEAIFDTGSNGSFTVDEQYLPPSYNFIKGQSFNLGVHGEKTRNFKLAAVPYLDINNILTLENQFVTFEKNMRFGIIGNKFLKNYKLTLDWNHLQILLEKYETGVRSPEKRFDFYPRFINNNVIVGSILLNSQAYKRGLRLNDEIVTINNLNFKEDSYTKYCQYLESRTQWEQIELTVQKEDKQLEFIFKKREVMKLLEREE